MPNEQIITTDEYVTIKFERGVEPWLFRDAIVVTSEQYAQLTPAQIDAMEQTRYDNWLAIVNPPQ
jgi:hypothetical protein